ncbi:MAG: UDP-N-acetylmuramoyl-L-alanyl-D-glutamate--2,6-diaminopimelate ligase [Candidatus Schekmanbacteria bacterium GWA2_38_9]|uniref:UDP-N-acetylmuramoyl-L-alanyl-D-glutamate--2,6-diaminopimelate ligase n=1 Tax=Candidatus Schekmanbacteria bacterium RIFCSPLOWO2_12_FULL_38_15 TaxID=1817883 RepID=A0A1F7SH35_9BACT|nr:MAG: UDP-N-acetylmuramoyl-L-alanyl-D-glutamate--2,6-diaminopimelate ligase [Candidatus Schekmanbacteria bacterium GWA2_38_9]OGL49701.1 MAG: UDP-N-acetylmuramoyl-L-alanyl-D-glutamate--2,6-diaminopimelate ligase [Candidatus Schekmanbacteria bacterium RIFCSPLOWO2_02_FULL_38_14]OGL53055.1 MAG: UDP-N-acetylmuramoyl-L-alanyl-D-glutamate--2,6-diaminopimelate ligase [Candidatus Schekmanbacteria bacterium RIFCSPLOWO2_12_FULL_38_15]
MLLKELIEILSEKSIYGNEYVDISGVEYDSRKVKEGSVFVAVKGMVDDGHLFIGDAVKSGAKAVVVNRGFSDINTVIQNGSVTAVAVPDSRKALALVANKFYGFPSKSLGLIGITGTNGKTTTSYLIESILSQDGKRTGLIGTISYHIGDRIVASSKTTPESLDLQRILKEMLESKSEFAVMEVSSHSLELDRVLGCNFTAAVYTNLSQEHLDFHGNMKNYLESKKRLFKMLDAVPDDKLQPFAVINADDLMACEIKDAVSVRAITYGLKPGVDVRAVDLKGDFNGIRSRILFPDDEIEVFSPLIGEFNIYNILASAATAYYLGVRKDEIKKGIESLKSVPGRFQRVEWKGGFDVIVDYAHTPDALLRCLIEAKKISGGYVITVFGCGGNRDKSKRPVMGKIASELSDIVFITSDNPRREDPLKIIDDIKAGINGEKNNGKVRIVPDRKKAIFKALEAAKPNDLVIIAGKGHENYQILGEKIIHFDDREVIMEKLEEIKVQ